MEMAIRGKNKEDEAWQSVYSFIKGKEARSTVTLWCSTLDLIVCDAVEVGIIGNLEFEMYDVIILAWGSRGSDLPPVVDFRLSHLNDRYLAWFAIMRLTCLFITSVITVLYFLRTCRKTDLNRFTSVKFSFE